ncbi:uncharacterized protein LOC129619641 [Bubalus kerabau]|uniref:uncharacterized protein LOC129619641 n=1 Tax=Bubalus carabanensis TaxID=3119969 RepID=UPI00244ED060|nr:uncharacterized protein LOC129619641 [Bubalus carabanensis]
MPAEDIRHPEKQPNSSKGGKTFLLRVLLDGGTEKTEGSGGPQGIFRGRQTGPHDELDREIKNEKSRITSVVLILITTLEGKESGSQKKVAGLCETGRCLQRQWNRHKPDSSTSPSLPHAQEEDLWERHCNLVPGFSSRFTLPYVPCDKASLLHRTQESQGQVPSFSSRRFNRIETAPPASPPVTDNHHVALNVAETLDHWTEP